MKSIGRFRRVSKDLDAAALQLTEDIQSVWEDTGEVVRILTETREALGSIQAWRSRYARIRRAAFRR